MTTIWLRVESTPGGTAKELADALAEAASRLGMGLMCDANGVDMMAVPGMGCDEIFRIWCAGKERFIK